MSKPNENPEQKPSAPKAPKLRLNKENVRVLVVRTSLQTGHQNMTCHETIC